MQQHVHLADGPGACRCFSCPASERLRGSPPTRWTYSLGLDQHAARAAGRVVDAHACLRLDDLDQRADDLGGRVELAALLAGGVGEVFDQVFVGGAEQVGELEVLVAQRDLVEVLDEVRRACCRRASAGRSCG